MENRLNLNDLNRFIRDCVDFPKLINKVTIYSDQNKGEMHEQEFDYFIKLAVCNAFSIDFKVDLMMARIKQRRAKIDIDDMILRARLEHYYELYDHVQG